jgi:hypothetical protein
MSASQRIEHATAVMVLLFTAANIVHPAWTWLNWVTLGTLFGGLAVAFLTKTPADRERTRRGAWIIPVVALAVALQWVFLGGDANRVRAALLGAGLVLAATALAWVRRQ